MEIATAPWVSGESAGVQLAELGLTEELLQAALQRGEIDRATCTANDPSYLPGMLAQGRSVRALREALLPAGWSRDDVRGLPLVVSPNGDLALTVATGDEGTGDPHRPASSKHPKGAATAMLVATNQLLLDLPGVEGARRPDFTTWVLLFRRAPGQIVAELSLPRTITREGKIVEWEQRIMLTAIPLDGDMATVRPVEPEPDAGVVVRPRDRG